MSCITLLTDFGDSDEYVGVMKGVILSIAPNAPIVDLTHKIAPWDVVEAAYLLKASHAYFPAGSVHTAVVDPGVGSDRKIIALKMAGQFFLAPDNGLLSPIWRNEKIEKAVWVRKPEFFLPRVSHTFHGRDIFAPAAARIFLKTPLERFGPPVDPAALATLKTASATISSDGVVAGTVIAVDRFGNLVTNIEADTVLSLCREEPEKTLVAEVGGKTVAGLRTSYQQAGENSPLLIVGSRGYLEIAVNRAAADRALGVGKGAEVKLKMEVCPEKAPGRS